MLIKVGNDYEKVTYRIDTRNVRCLDTNGYKIVNKNEDFLNKLNILLHAERIDWGNKEVYISFGEMESLIQRAKEIYDDINEEYDISNDDLYY